MMVEALPFNALTEEEWQAIRSVRVDWPDDIEWPKVRKHIEVQGLAYWTGHEGRNAFGLPPKMRKTLGGLLRQVRKLREGMKSLPRHVLIDGPDVSFEALEQRLEDWLFIYNALDGPSFSGRRDYYRDDLYQELLQLWVDPLEGRLSYSRKLDGTPYGPLIDFLTIIVTAILGKAPGPSGMAKIIDSTEMIS